tara:strand:+ start:3166 stop:3411 length:246 start_codon:yes stop_codon:yes gene_type:complete
MKSIKEITEELPIYWASYLINGDSSGLEDDEEILIKDTLEHLELSSSQCVSVSDDYSFRRGRSDLPDLLGGDYAVYTFISH